jgi:hypothetical protein
VTNAQPKPDPLEDTLVNPDLPLLAPAYVHPPRRSRRVPYALVALVFLLTVVGLRYVA